MAKKQNANMVSALLYLVIGLLLIIFRGEMLNWAMTIGGIFFIISGVVDLLKQNYPGGAMSLIIGLVVLLGGWLFLGIVLLVLGILIVIKGVFSLIDALRGKKSWISAAFSILSIVVGVMIAAGNALDTLLLIAGILMVVDGVLGLFAGRRA